METQHPMKRAVVILEELSKEDIAFYTKRRRGRPARKKKTEASRNLRDIERVDFSLYEDYRKSRKSYLKKSEKRKRSKKSSPKSEKKPRKKKSKIATKSLEQVPSDHGNPPSDLTPKSPKKSKKNKKRKKDPESTPKSKKKKLRRVVIESESDGDIESYGLFYTEGKEPQQQINGFQDPQKQVNGFQDPQDFMDVPPLQFFDYAATSQSMSSFVNLFSAGVDNDSDDILSALAIGSDDSFAHLGIQDPLSSVPIENSFLSRDADRNVDAEGIASKIVSECESVKSGYITKHILDQFDVVGDIFNLMDSNFSCRTNVPNPVPHESLPSVPQQQHDTRVMVSVPVVETLPQKSVRIITPNCSLEDTVPIVKQVLDTLVKKVSARNKRNISLQSKDVDKCIDKKCSLCSHSFMQVKSETLCISCKSYALGQLSSGSKNSIIKRTDKPLGQSLKMKSASLQKNASDKSNSSQKINVKPVISQTTASKKSTSKFSPLTPSKKRIAWKKNVESVSVNNGNAPRHFRSTILLTSPVKLNFKKSPIKRSLKKSPIKSNFKVSPLQRKSSPMKKNKSLDSDSRKKVKAPNAGNMKKVLKNFPANERHRILYKNKAKSKSLLMKDKETKSDNVESENMAFEAVVPISMNCTLSPVVKSQNFHITPIIPIMVAEEHKDNLLPEASNKSTTKQGVNEKNLQISNSDEDKDFSSQEFSINSSENMDCLEKGRNVELNSKTVKIFVKNQENISVVSKSSLKEHQTAINDIEASGNVGVAAENNISSNASLIQLKCTDDTLSIKPVEESSRVFDPCLPEVPAELTAIHLNGTKDNYNLTNSITLNAKMNSTVFKNSSASETSINSSSLQSLGPASSLQPAVGTLILKPLPQVLSLTPLTVVTISNTTPVITVLPISTVPSAETSHAQAQGTVSYPSTQLSEKTTISSVTKSNEHIASTSSQNSHTEELLAPGTSAASNVQQNSQTVTPPKSNQKLSLKSNSNESPTKIALYELEAFAILSVLDMDTELDPEHTRHYIERLLRKEITTFKNVKNVNLADLNEDMAKLVQAKCEQSCYRIKSLIAACVLWIQCGSLEKVQEHILSKQFSQAITMADKEFENRKFGNDLESWYSRDIVPQAKMERMEKSDCMFSKKSSSTENSMFPSLAICQTNASQTRNNSRIPVPPFIEDSFSDELEPLEVVFNPKLETSNSCMYSNNTIVDSVVPNVHDLNYGSVSMNNTIQSSVMVPDLGQLCLPSPLQSPAGPLTHSIFNASPIARINERVSQNLLPQASQIANPFDSNVNSGGNVPRMSPSVLQSQSPRSVSGLNHNIHNVPGLSPRSLQSPSTQPFNPLDLDSILTQTMVGSSRRNSRNSTSSIEPPVPQMSPVTVKQEKDLLSKSPCPNANNAIVPYGFLPTPSPTPPQPIVTQTQLQQPSPNQQLSSLLSTQLNSAQSAHLKSQLQQLSPQYANLLRNVSHQASDAPRPNNQTALNRLLPVLLNQSAHQVPTSLVHRVAPPNRVILPFNNNPAVNMGRNIPPNVTLGSPHPNFLNNKNMAANISLQLQNSNTNQIGPPNVSLHLPGSNLNIGVHRALPSNVSMSVQNVNSGGNPNFGQQQAPVSNSLVPVSLQQFILSGNSSAPSVNTRVPTQNNFNNFLVPYSNPSNNYVPSQQTVMSQPAANANNVLFSMLAQPQPNAYSVQHSQAKTNLRPPPPLYSSSSNIQNNTVTPPSNTQSEKQLSTHSLMYCAVCSKPATMRCKQCTKVVYCNATCARIYWHQKHKMECKVPC